MIAENMRKEDMNQITEGERERRRGMIEVLHLVIFIM